MKIKVIALLFSALIIQTNAFSQNQENIKQENKILDLKTKLANTNSTEKYPEINSTDASSRKSPGLALLLSLIVPGAGHYYLNRMDIGKYFLGIDVASWLGYATLNFYGNDVINDAKSFSNEHAKVTDINNKNDDYFANIGNYRNIYDFNNAQLAVGNYTAVYSVNQNFWDWDNLNNQNIFETQRKNSERIYNSRIIFGSILIANRIVSGISAYFIAKNAPGKSSSFYIEPELLYKKDYSFDGLKVNLSKNF